MDRSKRRGFIKGKLVLPFYKAAKSTSTVQYSSKVTSNQSSLATAAVGYIVHQDYVMSPPKQKVSFIVPDKGRESITHLEKVYGAGDESVDTKAANYISLVQERFKLERINSERERINPERKTEDVF